MLGIKEALKHGITEIVLTIVEKRSREKLVELRLEIMWGECKGGGANSRGEIVRIGLLNDTRFKTKPK